MITLTGILRQAGEVTIKEKPMVKLVVEHETHRDNGQNDIHLETMFLDKQHVSGLPGHTGDEITIEVRAYPSGRGVAFAGIRVLSPARAAAIGSQGMSHPRQGHPARAVGLHASACVPLPAQRFPRLN